MKLQTAGITILARRNPLTENDWFALLEERRNLLLLHMRDMSLKALGDLKIVHDDIDRGAGNGRRLRQGGLREAPRCALEESFSESIEPCEVALADIKGNGFDLDARGIYANDEAFFGGHYHSEFLRGGGLSATGEILRFWGLTRAGAWIKVECRMHYAEYQGKKRTEVKQITISRSDPREICQFCHVTLRWLWERLGDAVNAWVEHRREVLSQAESLAQVVRQERDLVSIIEPK